MVVKINHDSIQLES